jgi:hypothetical protein
MHTYRACHIASNLEEIRKKHQGASGDRPVTADSDEKLEILDPAIYRPGTIQPGIHPTC